MKQDMGIGNALGLVGLVAGILLLIALAFSWERPPVVTAQGGFRGVAMGGLYNPRTLETQRAANVLPATLPQTPPVGPKASAVYKNVQVLGDLSVGEFIRLMASMTTWVAPTQGCAYCHNTEAMEADTVYTKVVARRMIQMVQNVNENWTAHVSATGVTCYTCHRGNPVPANLWFNAVPPGNGEALSVRATGQNIASAAVGVTSLPYDPFTPFLEGSANIRDQSTTALPNGNRASIKQTEWTYGLMMHMSTALGVNCTYCHNTRNFGDWEQSTPQRATAWYGIRMVRELNNDYLKPLGAVFAANLTPPAGGPIASRVGPNGDAAKVNCATCHQGVYKPLFGASEVSAFPELRKVSK
jgi:photosynthetic reaction center cytochrome c subunit